MCDLLLVHSLSLGEAVLQRDGAIAMYMPHRSESLEGVSVWDLPLVQEWIKRVNLSCEELLHEVFDAYISRSATPPYPHPLERYSS